MIQEGENSGDYLADHEETVSLLFRRRWCIREDDSLAFALRAVAEATLSSLVLAIVSQTVKQQFRCYLGEDGASGRIRTSDRSVRSRVLYPAELRMQMAVRRGFEPRMQLLTAYSLSRGAPSASRPPHHTPLTSASKNLFIAHRRCVAHILLSETYKSNNFSYTFIVCTLHVQLVCKNVKKSVLSTEEWRSDR